MLFCSSMLDKLYEKLKDNAYVSYEKLIDYPLYLAKKPQIILADEVIKLTKPTEPDFQIKEESVGIISAQNHFWLIYQGQDATSMYKTLNNIGLHKTDLQNFGVLFFHQCKGMLEKINGPQYFQRPIQEKTVLKLEYSFKKIADNYDSH